MTEFAKTEFAKNLRKLMDSKGMSQRALAREIEVSNQLVSKWLSGEVAAPRGDKLNAIARVFKLRQPFDVMNPGGVDYLFGGRVAEDPVVYTSMTRAPVFGRISAGTPIAALPVDDSAWVPPTVLSDHPQGFYLRIEGNSMNKLFPDGHLVFVDPSAEVCSGQVAALHINGNSATVKRVLIGSSSITLVPESWDPDYKDEVFDQSVPDPTTITLIGRVVWAAMPYRPGL